MDDLPFKTLIPWEAEERDVLKTQRGGTFVDFAEVIAPFACGEAFAIGKAISPANPTAISIKEEKGQ